MHMYICGHSSSASGVTSLHPAEHATRHTQHHYLCCKGNQSCKCNKNRDQNASLYELGLLQLVGLVVGAFGIVGSPGG